MSRIRERVFGNSRFGRLKFGCGCEFCGGARSRFAPEEDQPCVLQCPRLVAPRQILLCNQASPSTFVALKRGEDTKSFRLVLQAHLRDNAKNRYLFETTRFTPFTVRRVQQIVQAYRQKAGITRLVHPHLFRHQMLTLLTARGLSDSQIQLISGHSSKKSLEIYQHLSLESVQKAYQDVVKTISV